MSSELSGIADRGARDHHIPAAKGQSHRIRRRLRHLTRTFERALPRLSQWPEGTSEGRAAEWLLDNTHLLAEALEQLRTGLSAKFLRELPAQDSSPFAGEPRVYAIARQLTTEEEGRLDAERVLAFLAAYQSHSPLTMAELWALPLMLRLVLLEDLAATAAALAEIGEPGQGGTARLWQGPPPPVPRPDAVGAHVQGLRWVAAIHWASFFEQVSRVHGVLCGDPAGVYPRMDF